MPGPALTQLPPRFLPGGISAVQDTFSARLRDSLSNLSPPLVRLLEALDGHQPLSPQQVKLDAQQAVIDQTGAGDAGSVRLDAEETRYLTADEAKEVAAAYERGETMNSLAQRLGVHRTTISKQLDRTRTTKRPKIKLTEERLAQAKKFYLQGWSTQRIAWELKLGQTTVYDALKEAGVQMRRRGPRTT